MSSRRLLIVTYHFPPSAASGGFRILGFARHLPASGWAVSVVAPPTIPWEAVDRGLLDRVPEGTDVFRAPYPDYRLARRLAPFASWFPRAAAAVARAIRAHPADALLTSGPPHSVHVLGMFLKRWHKIPWVVDFRDPWVSIDAPTARQGPRAGLVRRLEGAVMKAADLIVTNAPMAGERLRAAYPQHAAKIRWITNGYDAEDFRSTAGTPEGPSGAVNIVHAGSIYAGRDPRPVFDAIGDIERGGGPGRRPHRLYLYGMNDGQAGDLDAEVRRRGLEENIVRAGQIPYAEVLKAMMRADVLLLLDTPGRRIGVPAKLYEYIGAGRPILALGEHGGDLEWVLRESGLPHRIVPPTDSGAIARALAELADAASDGQSARPGGPGRSGFTRERLAAKLAGALDEIVGPQGGRRPGGQDG